MENKIKINGTFILKGGNDLNSIINWKSENAGLVWEDSKIVEFLKFGTIV